MHLLPTTNLSSVWSKSCWRYLSSYLWFLLSTLCSIFWPSWPQRHHRTLSSPLQNPDNTVPAVFLESIHLVALSKTEMRLTWQEMRSVWQLVVKHWTMWELIVWVNNVRHAQQCNRKIKQTISHAGQFGEREDPRKLVMDGFLCTLGRWVCSGALLSPLNLG